MNSNISNNYRTLLYKIIQLDFVPFFYVKNGTKSFTHRHLSPTPPHCDSTIGHPSTLKLWCEMLETVPPQWLWEPSPTALGDLPLKQRRARRQATEDCSTTTEKHKNNYRNTLFQPIIQNKYVTLQILLHIITSP